jgi:hypothetical protein
MINTFIGRGLQMNHKSPSRTTKATLIVIMLIQGCLLLTLHKLLENNLWPEGKPAWIYLLYTLSVAIPLTLGVVMHETRDKWPWLLTLAYGVLLAMVALYSGHQCEPAESVNCGSLVFAYVLTLGISWFIVLFFIQTWLDERDRQFPYTLLFNYSWQNFLTLGLAGLFTQIFWGILILWAALFDVLGISFFKTLFQSLWFIYPVTGFVAGLGIVIFRFQINAVGTLRSILAVLMRGLLPLLAFISLLFLLTLPFTGLEPLWKTGYGTMLLLCLIALVLFFTNAVYQDDAGKRPYGLALHRIIQFAVAAQVFFIGCCFYGLSLRVDQYGWTVDRLWGAIITLILSGFVLAYAIAIIIKRDQWLDWLKQANKGMALFVAVLCLLVNSPALDFRKISVVSQLARLESGRIKVEEFDYQYFARELARPGYLALERLQDSALLKDHPGMLAVIKGTLERNKNKNREEGKERSNIHEYVRIYPKQSNPPEAVLDLVYEQLKDVQCIGAEGQCYLLETDLNGLKGPEYVLIISRETWATFHLYAQENGKWKRLTEQWGGLAFRGEWNEADIRAALEQGDIRTAPAEWKDLYIGNTKVYVR